MRLGKIKMQGYDKDDLSGMVEKITSGSTKALGNIEMDGYSSDNLTSMLEKVTEGATGALSYISMDGLDESEFQDLVGKIGDGATNSLGEIRMTGYDHEKPPSDLTDKINLGTNDGFKKLKTRSKAAYVTGVTATQSDGSYQSGSQISVRVTFSQNVFVEGSPSLVLETGSVSTDQPLMHLVQEVQTWSSVILYSRLISLLISIMPLHLH